MTAQEILAELQQMANPQTRAMWLKHGAVEPCLGVKVEDMKKIQKRVKKDHTLALELYATGIADAMYLAGLIAEPARMTRENLQTWVEAATTGWVAEYTVPWVASESPFGRELALKWMEDPNPAIASAGWQTYGSLVAITQDGDLDLEELKALLGRVATTIHQRPNRVKYVMNNFVIAVGCYVALLHEHAMEVAKGLGKVEVDLVGECKIPFAPDYILKFAARSPIGKKRKSPRC